MNIKNFSHSNNQTNKISINHKLMCHQRQRERVKRRLSQQWSKSSVGGQASCSQTSAAANDHYEPQKDGPLSLSLYYCRFLSPKPDSLLSSAMPEPHEYGHHTRQHKSTGSPPLMVVNLSLFLFYPLVDLVIRLWKLENFIWVWEMRACRSVGFDMCPVEIVYVFSNGFLIWVVIFFSVCLDRKSWFLEKILNAQNIVF